MTVEEVVLGNSKQFGIHRMSDADILVNHICNRLGVTRQSELPDSIIDTIKERYSTITERTE